MVRFFWRARSGTSLQQPREVYALEIVSLWWVVGERKGEGRADVVVVKSVARATLWKVFREVKSMMLGDKYD